MAIIDQLLIKLNSTELQQRDQKLYDFLDKLLQSYKITNNAVNNIIAGTSSGGGGGGGGGGTTINNFITQQFLEFGNDSGDSGGGDIIPGSTGQTGAIGPQGPAGVTTFVMIQEDGIDGESIAIPGGIGPTGLTGAAGPTGPPMYIDPELPEDPLIIPGVAGIAGIQGNPGFGMPGEDGYPGEDSYIPSIIPGPTGPMGPQGPQGIPLLDTEYPEDPLIIQGPQGTKGLDGGTSLLAFHSYAPSVNTFFSTTSTTLADIDATNMAVTFVAPPSGVVKVVLTAYADLSNTTGEGFWGLREGSSNISGAGGVVTRSVESDPVSAMGFIISGLTPGTSHTYKWSQGVSGGFTLRTGAGPGNLGATVDTSAGIIPALMEVWDTTQSTAASVAKFTQDLGIARSSGTFDITGLGGLTANKFVSVWQTDDAIASKGNAQDEFEMDAIVLTGFVLNSTTIRVSWFAANGSIVAGIYAFAYLVSG